MRNISFLNLVEFNIDGNISNKALTLGDVDNDNNFELVIGCRNGKLLIYKYIQSSLPWATAADLGMIVCVDVGDVCNQGMNKVLTLSVDGWCNLFNIKSKSEKEENIDQKLQSVIQLTSEFKQKLATNIKVCLIVDIDGDGMNELVIGYTDRIVRYYKWEPSQICSSKNSISGSFIEQEKWTLTGQIGSISSTRTKNGTMKVMVSQPGGSYVALVLSRANNSQEHIPRSSSIQLFDVGSNRLRNLDVSSEIISDISRQPPLPLNQPNIPLLSNTSILECEHNLPMSTQNDLNTKLSYLQDSNLEMSTDTNWSSKTRHYSINNTFISTQSHSQIFNASQPAINNIKPSVANMDPLIANHKNIIETFYTSCQHLSSKQSISNYSATCTLDGTLNLIDEDDKLLWSLCVDHQLFSIKKLDITRDGSDEVVVCSWDGKTYIVNLLKEVVKFQFRETVAAFHAGLISTSKGILSPCFVYITFNNKVVIYYNIFQCSICCKTLSTTNVCNPQVKCTNSFINETSKNKLINYLLYSYN